MKPEILVIFSLFAFFAVLEFFHTGFFRKKAQQPGDGTVEIVSALALLVVTQPIVLLSGGFAASIIAPGGEGVLATMPFVVPLLLLLVFDDMTQYWWHRLSHSIPFLYKLHRPHHNPEYLSIRVVYRNNLFYYLLMPGLWFSGALIYFGAGWAYAVYITVKMAVIYGAHSDVRWDEPLYKIKWLAPVMWVVERTISTPATHSAHHGRHANDGITNYKGNYGNLLFFWDILFGTAKITRQYPVQFGVENLPPTSVGEQLFWPIIRTSPGIEPAKPPR